MGARFCITQLLQAFDQLMEKVVLLIYNNCSFIFSVDQQFHWKTDEFFNSFLWFFLYKHAYWKLFLGILNGKDSPIQSRSRTLGG